MPEAEQIRVYITDTNVPTIEMTTIVTNSRNQIINRIKGSPDYHAMKVYCLQPLPPDAKNELFLDYSIKPDEVQTELIKNGSKVCAMWIEDSPFTADSVVWGDAPVVVDSMVMLEDEYDKYREGWEKMRDEYEKACIEIHRRHSQEISEVTHRIRAKCDAEISCIKQPPSFDQALNDLVNQQDRSSDPET